MKSVYLWLLLAFTTSYAVKGQEYRLSYDPSTVPELYGETNTVLEKRVGNEYLPYRGTYRLYSNDAKVIGRRITYDPSFLQNKKGRAALKYRSMERSCHLHCNFHISPTCVSTFMQTA
jgi:hypothetical protein